jgi:hypothetical protein
MDDGENNQFVVMLLDGEAEVQTCVPLVHNLLTLVLDEAGDDKVRLVFVILSQTLAMHDQEIIPAHLRFSVQEKCRHFAHKTLFLLH